MYLRIILFCALLPLLLAATLGDFPQVKPEIHQRLYEQLALIHQVCTKHKIKYWLIGGSLLGQVRGDALYGKGAIIPWDDDADIGIDIADKERFSKALSAEALKVNMRLWNSAHGFKLNCALTKGVGTDVFFYKKVDRYAHPSLEAKLGEPVWILANEVSRKAWPSDFFLESELKTLAVVKFGHINAVIPGSPLRYLHTLYGDNCLSVGRLGYNHAANKPHDNAGTTIKLNVTKTEL